MTNDRDGGPSTYHLAGFGWHVVLLHGVVRLVVHEVTRFSVNDVTRFQTKSLEHWYQLALFARHLTQKHHDSASLTCSHARGDGESQAGLIRVIDDTDSVGTTTKIIVTFSHSSVTPTVYLVFSRNREALAAWTATVTTMTATIVS